MSIRRVGFSPFVSSANYIEAQKRVEAVEKHASTEDAELKTEEEALESLNAQYLAELEAVEAERAQQQALAESLRTELTLRDGYETLKEGPVDLKGGVEEPIPEPMHPDDFQSGVSLASLARANVYQTTVREEQRAAARQAELEREEAQRAALEQAAAWRTEEQAAAPQPHEEEQGDGEPDEDWMRSELAALDAQNDSTEALDEDEEGYQDPGADAFYASLEDVENLEAAQEEQERGNGFYASLDDIAHLVPESAPEVLDTQATENPPDAPEVQAGVEPSPGVDVAASVEPAASVGAVPNGEPAVPVEGAAMMAPPEPVAVSAPLPESWALPFDEEAAPAPVPVEPTASVMLPFDSDSSS